MNQLESRRQVLRLGAGLVAGTTVAAMAACGGAESGSKEVLAVEDMMREHGVLRRALLVYAEAAARLRSGQGAVPADALAQTAALFHSFGEDYHERKLEEAFVFPAVAKAGGPAAALPAVLKTQHDRGREITDYITAVTRGGTIASASSGPLAQTLDSFVRMYQHHAALEDTLVFPAWKATMSSHQYEELSDRFEDLEKQMFGKDGFADAVTRIGQIERAFGLDDPARLTPPPPPHPAA